MPEIGTSGSMSGDAKRSDAEWPQATAPILDSTATRRPDTPGYVFIKIGVSFHPPRPAAGRLCGPRPPCCCAPRSPSSRGSLGALLLDLVERLREAFE